MPFYLADDKLVDVRRLFAFLVRREIQLLQQNDRIRADFFLQKFILVYEFSNDIPTSELPTSRVVESKRVAAHSLPVRRFHRQLNTVSNRSFIRETNVWIQIQIDGRNVR